MMGRLKITLRTLLFLLNSTLKLFHQLSWITSNDEAFSSACRGFLHLLKFCSADSCKCEVDIKFSNVATLCHSIRLLYFLASHLQPPCVVHSFRKSNRSRSTTSRMTFESMWRKRKIPVRLLTTTKVFEARR